MLCRATNDSLPIERELLEHLAALEAFRDSPLLTLLNPCQPSPSI